MAVPFAETIAPVILKPRALDLTARLMTIWIILKNTPLLLSLLAASIRLQLFLLQPPVWKGKLAVPGFSYQVTRFVMSASTRMDVYIIP
jgi:hypothetical protein